MTLLGNALRLYSAQSAKARVPMIKFRKGAAASSSSTTGGAGQGHGSAVSGAAPKKPKSKKSASQQTSASLLSELPRRFHRQPISEEEIEYINRGGPA